MRQGVFPLWTKSFLMVMKANEHGDLGTIIGGIEYKFKSKPLTWKFSFNLISGGNSQ
jgi:hypothetical protein